VWDRTELPPPAIPANAVGADSQAPTVLKTTGAKWAQYCTFHGASDLDDINRWLKAQGQQGWELVSVGGNAGTVYCFKARL
jgi:hypothetical protein